MQESYLAKNIKRYRKERGFSQEDLARAAGITYSALSKIEAGYSQDPRVKTLQKIARALEVTIDDLMKE
jgi:transcriptional regulator with XRE-family HTH domain